MFSYRIGFWSVLAEDKSFISVPGRKEGVTVWSARYAQRDKKCLGLSWTEKSSAKSFELLEQLLARWCSLVSVRESVPVEIFDYLLHSAGLATASLELRDCSCLRFKYLQNALINLVVESLVEKVEDTILHRTTTVRCQFNYSFSCRKFVEIWTLLTTKESWLLCHV